MAAGRWPIRTEAEEIRDFWARVDQSGGPDACWLWTKARFEKRGGYGAVRFLGKTRKAHHVAYEVAIGPRPKSKLVLHTCDNPPCCNPRHLHLGTYLDNVREMDSRGRRVVVIPKGVNHWSNKLRPEQVLEIRAASESHRVLATRFGVNRATIKRIRNRTIWRDL